MGSNDPDSGYPTPRDGDDEDQQDTTTQSQFLPTVTSTPKEATRMARLNLRPLSENDHVSEEGLSSQVSRDELDSPGQRLKKNMQFNRTKRELSREKSKTEKLKREVDEILNENSILKGNLDTSIATVDDKDATIEALNESLTTLKQVNTKISADVEVLKLGEEEAERELEVYQSTNSKLKKDILNMTDRLQQLEEELTGAQSLATQKVDENVQLSSTIKTTKHQLDKINQEFAQLGKKYSDEKLASAEQITLIEQSLKQSEMDKQQLQDRFDQDMKNRDELARENEELRTLTSSMKATEYDLHNEIQILTKNYSDCRKICDEWKLRADQYKQNAEEFEKKNADLSVRLQEKTYEIEQVKMDFQQKQEDLNGFTEKVALHTIELDNLKNVERKYTDALQKIKDVTVSQKSLEDELQSKNGIVTDQKQSISLLQEKISKYDVKNEELQAALCDSEARIQILKEDIERINTSLEEFRQNKLHLIADQARLKKEIINKNTEIENLCREVDSLKCAARCQREAIENSLQVVTAKNSEHELLITNLKSNESSLLNQIEQLQSDISNYKQSCDEWRSEADQCKTDIETLEKERTKLSTNICSKTAELSQLTMDFQKLQLDVDEATQKISLQSSELDILKEKESDFLDAVQKMKDAANRKNILEAEINSKDIILKEQEKSIGQLQAKIIDYEAKASEFEASRTDFLARIKTLTEANERAKATVEKARQVETQLINDQVKLRTEVSSKKNEVANLQKTLTKTKESERLLREQLNSDQRVAELLTEEKNKNSQLSDQLAEFEKINRGLVDENGYLRNEFGNRPHIDEIARLQQEIQQKTRELEEIKKSERGLLEERERLNTELLALKEDFENKRTEIDSLLDDMRAANGEIAKQKEIIGKLVDEHNDFEEDVRRREAEFDAAQTRLQELEALDGYPGRSVGIDTCDVSVNTSMNYESHKTHMEILVRENDSLRSTLDNERQRVRELKTDLRKQNVEARHLREKLDSEATKLRRAEESVEHFRHECNSLELLLADRDAHLRTLTAECNINKLALSEMKEFLAVDNPRRILEFEEKISILNADVERLKMEKIRIEDDVDNKDEQIFGLTAHVKSLTVELREVKSDHLRTRELIKISQENVKELLKKMEDQDFFIERIRNRNSDRQLVIDAMEQKLKKAYVELGREPNWGKVPQKKGRWVREEAEEQEELASISNAMQSILRNRKTEMLRASRYNYAEEPKRDSRD